MMGSTCRSGPARLPRGEVLCVCSPGHACDDGRARDRRNECGLGRAGARRRSTDPDRPGVPATPTSTSPTWAATSFFGPAAAPQSRLNLGPFTAPVGRRSLGLVTPGPGTATGPFSRFDSLTGLDSTFSATGQLQASSYVWTVTAGHAAGSGMDRPRRHRPGGRRVAEGRGLRPLLRLDPGRPDQPGLPWLQGRARRRRSSPRSTGTATGSPSPDWGATGRRSTSTPSAPEGWSTTSRASPSGPASRPRPTRCVPTGRSRSPAP